MPDAAPIVEPVPQVPPQVTPQVAPQSPLGAPPVAPDAADAPPRLPPDLMKIPAVQALVAGAPPAFSATIKEMNKRGEAEVLAKHKGPLEQAGMGFYKSMSGHIGVIYNSLYIHPADIQAADKAGKLQVIAPPFDQVNHMVGKSGLNHPALARTHVPNGQAQPTPQAPPQSAQMAPSGSNAPAGPSPGPSPATAGVQRRLMAARLANMQPGNATAAPPGGRLLQQILKPVV